MAGRRPRGQTHRIVFKARNRHTLSSDEAGVVARDWLVDEAFQRYLDWRRESSMCEPAYRRWRTSANPRESALAFATYSAALDGEEHAAAQYERAFLAAGAMVGCEPVRV